MNRDKVAQVRDRPDVINKLTHLKGVTITGFMQRDSVSQAIVRGALIRIQNSQPLQLSGMEITMIKQVIDSLSAAFPAVGSDFADHPVVLDEVQKRMVIALLQEYVLIPSEP